MALSVRLPEFFKLKCTISLKKINKKKKQKKMENMDSTVSGKY